MDFDDPYTSEKMEMAQNYAEMLLKNE